MERFTRAMHFDFHTMPGIKGLFDNFNAEDFAQRLSDNHVKYINFTARCNIGFSYYDTKVGKKYPGLKRDILKEVIDACHKRDIGVTAYINAGLNHEFAADDHGCCRIDKEGRVYRGDKADNFFRTMCYNTRYGDYLISEIKEIAAYDIDGLFCDCMILEECYCPACMTDMRKKGVDTENREQVLEYQRNLIIGVCRRIREAVGKDINFYFNSVRGREKMNTHAEIECLPSASWGYDYFWNMAAYSRTRYADLLYMSGRFAQGWGDFGGVKPLASMQNDLYDSMMNASAISFGDHLHPVDGLENEVIERVGKVFAERMKYEKYISDAKYVAEVGVLVNLGQHLEVEIVGLSRMLCELKIPFNIYDPFGDFCGLKVLIIPKEVTLTQELSQKLKAFCTAGGKILFSGTAVNIARELKLCDYADIIGKDCSDNAYFRTEKSGMRWAMYYPSVLIKNVNGKEFGSYVGKMFNLIFDGRQSYYYRPQGADEAYSVAVTDGNTACICFDVFKAYAESFLIALRDLVLSLIGELLPERFIEARNFPASTLITVTENEKNRVIHVKATFAEIRNGKGIIEDHCYIPGGEISIRGLYKVYSLPQFEELPYSHMGGRTIFETGAVHGYKAFSLIK